tara:strand:- start:9866 stop:10303 length:438 start_codon:yes stop_codon:yes gene_type:complete
MANFSITVTNTLDFFGPANTDLWNAFTWGAANWGENADFGTVVTKVVDSTVSPDSDQVKYVLHGIDLGSTAIDSNIISYFSITITNDLTLVIDMYSETIKDGAGYNYLYPSDVTNAEDRDIPTWTSSGNNSTTWTPASNNSTTWS